ncbi:helix-turn-helix domain-containing protein [Morganella morganii]|uniref:helix-turn-helix domain-containing protein n=1 Tax=Morganella morganii TaxID=582 RepID=UPI001BDAB996|nr:helix-turn-helix domain-containing protein [Morganella morganii]MBT0318577.1 helix-turn-helix domain-containing protein [Morganella morganii subsp. morganii]
MAAPKGNKHAAGNKGKPSSYQPEYAEQARKLCLLGATDKELADFFNVSESTINKWKIDFVEFSESIKKGKDLADADVAERLFNRACGYVAPDVDIKVIDSKIVMTDFMKHYPPDTTAAIFWLKNRQKNKWRDKQEIDLSSPDGSMSPRGLNDFYADIKSKPEPGSATILDDAGEE